MEQTPTSPEPPPAAATPTAEQPASRSADAVEEPAKLLRISAMVRPLLDEIRQQPLDDDSNVRLHDAQVKAIQEICDAVGPDLRGELPQLDLPLPDQDTPTADELRVAQAQLAGWLEGIFHGIQAGLSIQHRDTGSDLASLRNLEGQHGKGGDQRGESEASAGGRRQSGHYL